MPPTEPPAGPPAMPPTPGRPGPPPSSPPPSGPLPSGPPPSGPLPAGDPGAVLRAVGARIAGGDWRTASLTALAAYGTALLGSLLFVALLAPDLPVWEWLVAVAALTAATFTVDVVANTSADGVDITSGSGAVPLVLTTLSLGVACWVFWRRSRGRSSYLVSLGDAARAGVVLGALLLVTALVFRTDLGEQTESADDLLAFLDMGELEVAVGINRASAFFLGMIVLFGVLALAGILRRDWLGARLQRVHDVVAAPLVATASLLAVLPALGIAGYLAILTGDFGADELSDGGDGGGDSVSWHANLAVRAIAVSNVGAHFLSIGAGGRVGGSMEYDASGLAEGDEAESQWGRLGWLSDQSEAWGLWFAIPLMLLTVAALTWLVHRTSGQRAPLASLLVWGGGSFVVFGWLLRLASAHGSADLEFDVLGEQAEGSMSFVGGSPVAEGLLLGLITLVTSVALAAARGLVDLPAMAARLRQLQATGPGTPPPGPPPRPAPTQAPAATPAPTAPAAPPPSAPPPAAPPAPADETWRPPGERT